MKEINKNQISWTVACVNEYAKYKAIDIITAFQYLFKHGGIEFLKEHYEAEHLLSLDDTVEDLDYLCRNNGGTA